LFPSAFGLIATHLGEPFVSTSPTGCRRSVSSEAQKREIALASTAMVYYDDPIDMDTVTVSPKYQVVIPLVIREEMHLSPGEKLRVIRYEDRVEMIRVRPIETMRGFLKGIDTTIEREDDRL